MTCERSQKREGKSCHVDCLASRLSNAILALIIHHSRRTHTPSLRALHAFTCTHPTAPLLALAADSPCQISITFQPAGATNVPAGWTPAGQAALKPPNKDWWKMSKIKLAATPVPVLNVAPYYPLTNKVPSCVAECLPPPSKGARRLSSVTGPDDTAAAAEAAAAQESADRWWRRWLLAGGAEAEAAAAPGTAAAADAAPSAAKAPTAPGAAAAAAVAAATAAAAAAPAAPADKIVLEAGDGGGGGACAKASDPGNLLEAGSWTVSWSLDGGKATTMGPFAGSATPAAITLDKLADARLVRRGV